MASSSAGISEWKQWSAEWRPSCGEFQLNYIAMRRSRTAIRSSGLNISGRFQFLPLSVNSDKKRWNSIGRGNAPNVADGKINRWTSTVSFLLRMKIADGPIPAINCDSSHANCCDSLSEPLNDGHPPKERATKGRGPVLFIQSQWTDSNGCKVTAESIVDPKI